MLPNLHPSDFGPTSDVPKNFGHDVESAETRHLRLGQAVTRPPNARRPQKIIIGRRGSALRPDSTRGPIPHDLPDLAQIRGYIGIDAPLYSDSRGRSVRCKGYRENLLQLCRIHHTKGILLIFIINTTVSEEVQTTTSHTSPTF